jgi:hypothetical protein
MPVRDIVLKLKPAVPMHRLRLLRGTGKLSVKRLVGGWLELRLPELKDFEFVLFESQGGS